MCCTNPYSIFAGASTSAKGDWEPEQPLANGAQRPGRSSASAPRPRGHTSNHEVHHGGTWRDCYKETGCEQSEGSECRCSSRRPTVHQIHCQTNEPNTQLGSRSPDHSDARDAEGSFGTSKVQASEALPSDERGGRAPHAQPPQETHKRRAAEIHNSAMRQCLEKCQGMPLSATPGSHIYNLP